MQRVLVPLAPGFEEIEAVTVVDVLRRAGAEVTTAGTLPGLIRGSRGVQIQPDCLLESVRSADFDWLVLPGGGEGVSNLKKNPHLTALLGAFTESGKPIGAICAAPSLLAAQGLLCGKNATSHPSVRKEVADSAVYSEKAVVVDGKLITSRGPGTAMAFALTLAEKIAGPEKTAQLRQAMLAG
ncbi:MAG: DJ-1 family protein [Candidatus Omnitrophica bacterium CG11_big_fil_rev_8_21_14_0_20_64_10]|nr:MAG: DJ-1 family protein [Candidatus Omnitrophica bacterium CG11_big_fil_rev_8_21_14_0_20_64_10]